MEISRHFVKILFPFRYDVKGNRQLEQVRVTSKRGKEKPLFQKFGFRQVELRNGLPDVFAAEENTSKIVSCYKLNDNSRVDIGLPQRKTGWLDFHCRSANLSEPYQVAVPEVKLYLFETGVGLAELECAYQSKDITDYINCNYFLSEIKSEENFFVSRQKAENGEQGDCETTESQFAVKELLGRVLKYVPGVKDFYSENGWEKMIQKGVVYSYLYLDVLPENFYNLLFNLRNNYKESYQMPVCDKNINTDPAIRRPFDNSYWTASYNGAINVSLRTGVEETDQFFENDFVNKMQNVYYVLFLSVLHQRLAIIKLMGKMGKLDKLGADYETMRIQLAVARKYQAEAANMKFRVFFELPSHIEHINNYYDFLHQTYCIEKLQEHFTADLDNLESLCNVYVEKIKAREEQLKKCKTAKIEIFVGIFGTIVGGFSLLSDAVTLVGKLNGISAESFSWPVLVVALLLGIPSIMVLVDAYNRIREIQSIKEDIMIAEMESPEEREKNSKSKKKKQKRKISTSGK